MTTSELVKMCEPLVGRPIPFNQWDCAIWWRDAAEALAKENEQTLKLASLMRTNDCDQIAKLDSLYRQTADERDQLKAKCLPHMCRMDHPEIRHSGDNEMCPLCQVMNERDALKAKLAMADKLAELVEEAKNVMDDALPATDNDDAGGIWFDAHASYPQEFVDRAEEAIAAYKAAKGTT